MNFQKTFSFSAIVSLSFCVFLSGCSNNEQVNSQPEQTEASIAQDGSLIPINSDNVSAAGYSLAAMKMTVQFNNGAVYEYYGVPESVWLSFLKAQPNAWSSVGYPGLVQGGYAYQRIN